jgi:hypothetical protein
MAVIADFQVNSRFPSKVGGIGTTVKYFPRILGSSIGNVPVTPSASSPVGSLWVPGDDKLNAQQFDVYATGTFGPAAGDPSGTALIQLLAVTGSLAAPVYTVLADVDASAPNLLAASSWAIKAHLYGDSASGIVGGSYESYKNGAYDETPVNVENVLSGINFNGGNVNLYQGAPFGLVVGVTFGTTDASNTAAMFQFQVVLQ